MEYEIILLHYFTIDETYWEKGFTLAMAHGAGGMPLFLADLALAIFSSGKSLNLLRMCNAQVDITFFLYFIALS